MKEHSLFYIASFFILVLLISMTAGNKALYYFLILVLIGTIYVNLNRFKLGIVTPEIMR